MNKRLELREKSLKQQPETDKGHDRSLKEASVASEFTAGSVFPEKAFRKQARISGIVIKSFLDRILRRCCARGATKDHGLQGQGCL